MNALAHKTVLVTGGSRGLGRGIVEAVAGEGAQVWALARDASNLDQLKREVQGVETWAGDITDPQVAAHALSKIKPDVLILNAGATPTMAPIHELSWDQFNGAWETDVKATFQFGKEAILLPLAPGSVVVIISSGAALSGSPLSGSYAGAKRTQWLLGQYLQQESINLKLGIRFVVLVPRQIVAVTALGNQAATKYAALQGISKEEYLAKMGSSPLTPAGVGQGVVSLLTEDAYHEGIAYGVSSQGLASLN